MNGNTKRKNKANTNRTARNKTLDRTVSADGIYANARFVHAAVSLVGCEVQVQTYNGSLFEGIFRTFSPQFEIVLEMAHKVNPDKLNQISIPSREDIVSKFIFKSHDVVTMKCVNTDLDFATKEFFATDIAISKFNGQIAERELEPWDEGTVGGDDFPALDTESANGWNVDEMFRTNEQQYGVQSSYDSALTGYTTPLEKRNTDEYKRQEARASRIACEIESSASSKARNAIENGDDDEQLSAVVRPAEGGTVNTNKYLPPAKRKQPAVKMPRTSSSPQNSYSPIGRNQVLPHMHGQPAFSPHQALPASAVSASQASPAAVSAVMSSTTPSLPSSSSSSSSSSIVAHPPTRSPHPNQHSHIQRHHGHPSQQSHGPSPQPSYPSVAPVLSQVPLTGHTNATDIGNHEVENNKINGDKIDKEDSKSIMDSENIPPVVNRDLESKSMCISETNSASAGHIAKANRKPKTREEKVENLRDFQTNFKLSNKETSKTEPQEIKDKSEAELDKLKNTLKKSTLNPNAKEFVFNPNAKAFTPRSPSTQAPTPPRPHTPSTTYSAPTPVPVMPGQPIFTNMPTTQYIMSTPMVVPAHHFNPAATMQQGQRFRKTTPASMQQRPEFPTVQVAAATGQPILAPAPIQAPPQYVPYPPQGIVPVPGASQHSMPYTQFVQVHPIVGPRMVGPQAMTMVPTSHASTYQEAQHVPSQVFVTAHPGVPTPQHHGALSITAISSAAAHNSAVSTPNHQSQAGPQPQGMHPSSASAGHPPAPTPPSNASTPQIPGTTYQPQQPPLQPSPHTPNSPQAIHPAQTPTGSIGQTTVHHFHPGPMVSHGGGGHNAPHITQTHPHGQIHTLAAAFPGTAGSQSVVLIPGPGHGGTSAASLQAHQQAVHSSHTLHGHTIHGHPNPNQVAHLLSHSSIGMPMIPATSAAGAASMAPHQLYIHHPEIYVKLAQQLNNVQTYRHEFFQPSQTIRGPRGAKDLNLFTHSPN